MVRKSVVNVFQMNLSRENFPEWSSNAKSLEREADSLTKCPMKAVSALINNALN